MLNRIKLSFLFPLFLFTLISYNYLLPKELTFNNNTTIEITGTSVDTTDFFPIQIGNYWEYAAITGIGPIYFGLTVIGDTLMDNGKRYGIFEKKYINISGGSETWYYRKDSNKVYYGFPYSVCPEGEYIYLDFSIPDSTFWKVCRGNCGNARGAAGTYYDYSYYLYFQQPLETKKFVDVYTDSTDTIWVPCESYELWLSKGIGITRQFIFNDGDYHLRGAVINGVKYGVITGLEDEGSFSLTDFKIETYPNPFNSTVTLKLSLTKPGLTEVTIYNMLGQNIETIIKEYKKGGIYSIKYNSQNLSSGVYFILVKQNQRINSEKIILLK